MEVSRLARQSMKEWRSSGRLEREESGTGSGTGIKTRKVHDIQGPVVGKLINLIQDQSRLLFHIFNFSVKVSFA